MNLIKTLATFLGWCTIINFGFLFFGALAWMLVNESASQLGASMMGVTEEQIKVAFFNGVMVYRAGIFLFNLVPYIALKIIDRNHADVSV